MGRHDNYPDDIRQYDHDPRSPFYEEPDEGEDDDGDYLYDCWKDKQMEIEIARKEELEKHIQQSEKPSE